MLLFPYMATDGFHSDPHVHFTRMVEDSDYTTAFYASGKLVLANRLAEIYPPPDATALAGAAYDRAAHVILPNMSPGKTAICPYFPLVALLFSPLTYLAPADAFLGWQLLSLAALAVAAALLDALSGRSGKETLWGAMCLIPAIASLFVAGERGLVVGFLPLGAYVLFRIGQSLIDAKAGRQKNAGGETFWWALLFLPVIHCLFIGQSAILLGLLPLTAGFFSLRRGKPLAAGLFWSITFLKPQFLIAAGFICISLMWRKNYKPLVGLALGCLALCLANALLLGSDSFAAWLGAMKVAERVFSDAHNGVVVAIVASLPRTLILSVPASQHWLVKPLAYSIALLLGIIALAGTRRFARSDASQFDYDTVVCVIALVLVPLTAPHLFYYDLSAFVLAASLWAVRKSEPDSASARLVPSAILGWICINLYGAMLIVPAVSRVVASPWWLLLIYFEMYRRLMIVAFGMMKGPLVETKNLGQPVD